MATSQTISPELIRASSTSVIEATERVLRAGQAPGKSAFIARAMNALATLTTDLDERSLADAAGAQSDFRVLMKVLDNPNAYQALKEHDPLLPAQVRGMRARQELLESEGGTLSVSQVATLLGITRQAVDKRRRARTLIGLHTGRHGFAFPAWQFDQRGQLLAGLEGVLAELAEFSPWMQAGYLLSPNLRLGGLRPIDALRSGDADQVQRAASAYGEQGAA